MNDFFGRRPNLRSNSGFTLLETVIAMTIMLVAFGSILTIQGNSLNASERAKRMNVVGMLAKTAMVQTEIEIMGKAFDDLPKEKSGIFDPPYEDYSWTQEVKEVNFPSLSLGGSNPDSPDAEKNGAMQEQMSKLMAAYLKKALREIVVTVKWMRSGQEQKYVLSMYWVDAEATFDVSP